MTEREAFVNLLQTERLEGELALLLGSEPREGGNTDYRLGHTSVWVEENFRSRILLSLRKRRRAHESHEYTLIPFEPGYRPESGSHAILFLRVSNDPHLATALANFPSELTTLPEFTGRIARNELPYSFVLVGRLPTGEVVRFFKRVTAQIEL